MLKFYLIADTHYYKPKNFKMGLAYTTFMEKEQKCCIENGAICDATLDTIKNDDSIDTIIIPGDLTQFGLMSSHNLFRDKLYELKKANKKVFLIPAGHDFDKNAREFNNDSWHYTEPTNKSILLDFYKDFGISDAISIEPNTTSYSADINDEYRMIAILCDFESEYGEITENLLNWIKTQNNLAKKANKKVFAICHYPIIPNKPIFELFKESKVSNWRYTASQLADMGIKIVFTGHLHIQSVNLFTSEKGNTLVDVCTSTLIGYPAMYRKITLVEDKAIIGSIPMTPCEFNGQLVDTKYLDNQFRNMIQNNLTKIGLDDFGKLRKESDYKYPYLIKQHSKLRHWLISHTLQPLLKKLKLRTIGIFLFIKIDKLRKKIRLVDFLEPILHGFLEGDNYYNTDSFEYVFLEKLFKRFRLFLRIANNKLNSNGQNFDIAKLFLDSLIKPNSYSDNNCTIELT
ncbi:MAG: metallophosphoesterase [Clostridia bacterium]